MKTTLNKIHQHNRRPDLWIKLLNHLGKTQADDEPLSIKTILSSNGLDDALYCLRAVDGYEKELRLYSVWGARQVQHLMKDPRSLKALDVAEAFAEGKATADELEAARAGAREAESALYTGMFCAAKAAVGEAATAAAWTTELAAGVAAEEAVRAATKAAEWGAYDAVGSASWESEWAEKAATAAGKAAGEAVREAQKQELFAC